MATLSDTISNYVIERLSAVDDLDGVSIIRNADDSVDRGAFVVIVDTQDQGNHLQIPGRKLVDATVAMALCVHVTDDPSGSVLEGYRSALETVIFDQSAMTPEEPAGEWYIRYWEPSVSGISLDGNYRKITYNARMILQNINA